MSEQSDNRDRLHNLTDSLCRSRMYDAANRHKESVETMPAICGPPRSSDHAYHDFLDGWREAMEVTHAELLQENHELHVIVTELCTRLMLRRCDKCRGLCVDDDLNDCPACNGQGYIDQPSGEAEKVVDEIVSARRKEPS